MLAFRYEFCAETVFFCIICKGVEIEIKPVKRLSDNILVLHLVVKLAIIYSSTLAWKIPWTEGLVGCSPWGP